VSKAGSTSTLKQVNIYVYTPIAAVWTLKALTDDLTAIALPPTDYPALYADLERYYKNQEALGAPHGFILNVNKGFILLSPQRTRPIRLPDPPC
jgi:hypothetical protein